MRRDDAYLLGMLIAAPLECIPACFDAGVIIDSGNNSISEAWMNSRCQTSG